MLQNITKWSTSCASLQLFITKAIIDELTLLLRVFVVLNRETDIKGCEIIRNLIVWKTNTYIRVSSFTCMVPRSHGIWCTRALWHHDAYSQLYPKFLLLIIWPIRHISSTLHQRKASIFSSLLRLGFWWGWGCGSIKKACQRNPCGIKMWNTK
jgi:hypothetical protein